MGNKSNNLVLGIDPGTHTGWAIVDQSNIVSSGTVSFEKVASKGYGAMFVQFRHFLQKLNSKHGPFKAIAYELPFLRGPYASRILWGMAAHMQERSAMWHCRILSAAPMTIKKAATGSGKATKEEMIAVASTLKCPVNAGIIMSVMSEHEADAIHIARWASLELGKRGQHEKDE